MRTGPLVVVGDTLLDVDLDGTSDRLSPDAPVPVVDAERQSARPGGAGLAALLGARAGLDVVLVTPLGTDDAADTLLRLLDGEVEVIGQPMRGQTVVKTRIRTAGVPLARLDTGDGTGGDRPLGPAAAQALQQAGAVLVSDYGRGLTGQRDLRALLRERAREIPLIWDPHPRGAAPVAGAGLVTPNLAEAERFAPGRSDPHSRGLELCRRWKAAAVAVTDGERGAALSTVDPAATVRVPVPVELGAGRDQELDTCGAGDRFAVAAAAALQRGEPVSGAVSAAVAEASEYVLAGGAGRYSTRIGPGRALSSPGRPEAGVWTLLERTRRAGGRIVATGGCFDLLHAGHVDLLQRARALGDLLVVCLNSDASVRRAKGVGRPVVGQDDRARVLRALAAVDGVAIFDEDTPSAVLERIRPDIWVKGRDYAGRGMPEAGVVTRCGGRIVLLPLTPDHSTSRLIDSARLLLDPLPVPMAP